jgi:hypothetical protein
MGILYAIEELHGKLLEEDLRRQRECLFAYRVEFGIMFLDNTWDMQVTVHFYCCFIPRHSLTPPMPTDLEPAAPAVALSTKN